MNRPRQMRRHARRMRRYGLQPMMVIGSRRPAAPNAAVMSRGGPGGYRSELGPLWSPRSHAWAAVCCTRPTPRWRVIALAAVPGVTACLGGARLGLPHAPAGIRRDVAAARRLARRRGRGRPVALAAAAAPGHRRRRPGGPLVGAPAATSQGAGRAQARSLARSRPGSRAGRITGPCPPWWMCGDGGRGSPWPAARPSPT